MQLSDSSGFIIKLVRAKILHDCFNFPTGFLEYIFSFHKFIVGFSFFPVQSCMCVPGGRAVAESKLDGRIVIKTMFFTDSAVWVRC